MNIGGNLNQTPEPACHLLRFQGDVETFELKLSAFMEGDAWVRTNLGHADIIRQEIIDQVDEGLQPLNRSWYDIPMTRVSGNHYRAVLPLCETGHFEAKCFFIQKGDQTPLWPPGENTHINVELAETCGANIIYNAFVRQFGPNKAGELARTDWEPLIKPLDAAKFTVIPPSGAFRDLIAELDFIIGHLGCRIIQLLPVHATPTTYARMGRFGSPYAALNFMSVDPSMAVFDPAATPTEQFTELIDAIHTRKAKIFMDIAINHTGWAAWLHDTHPEWLVRGPNGRIEMPGAWGVTWADLTRLDYTKKALWQYMARMFLHWCRQGVDGFRCDAGYMIPEAAWAYIVARVRKAYPDTVFFLEGLGGPMAVTCNLLNRANLNWAYSELFQNFDREQIESYLPQVIDISQCDGVMVHFAETHDNNRLAARSKTWARLRTALCALTARHGAFGFANGVEWFADAKIDVHRAPSLNWGAADNQVDHIRRLNLILRSHPAFADDVNLAIVPKGDGNYLALHRFHRVTSRQVLILANLSDEQPVCAGWNDEKIGFGQSKLWDLVTGETVLVSHKENSPAIDLDPGRVLCLTDDPDDLNRIDRNGDGALTCRPRRIEDQCFRAKALDIHRYFHGMKDMGDMDPVALVESLRQAPDKYCDQFQSSGEGAGVIQWRWPTDQRREVIVPPGHFLLVQAPAHFRAWIARGKQPLRQETSLPCADGGHFVLFRPLPAQASDHCRYTLSLSVFEIEKTRHGEGTLFIPALSSPKVTGPYTKSEIMAHGGLYLDTNGRGGMLRAAICWGELNSRYDALLAANLNPDYPEDRWIMFTRCRAWIVFQGFSTEINGDCLDCFSYQIGRGGRWQFRVPTGQGEHVQLTIAAAMVPDKNAMVLVFYRSFGESLADGLSDDQPVRLILRPDIEDRSFHDTTKAYAGPEDLFPSAVIHRESEFEFIPASHRRLEMTVKRGTFASEPEWHYMVHRPLEAKRGLDPDSDLFSPGYFTASLKGGDHELLTAGISTPDTIWAGFTEQLVTFAMQPIRDAPHESSVKNQLTAALGQYVVKRGNARSVVAGYPWFLDWGRDALIFTRGLIAAGRYSDAHRILIQFGRFEQNGTLPNMIHGQQADNRETSDAPLWLFTACADLIRDEKNRDFLQADCDGRPLFQILLSIANAMIVGTRHGVRMDPESGLIFSPVHFTWMDTNHPAGSPRQGYPVEIQALWYAALVFLAKIDSADKRWGQLADKVQISLMRYFYREKLGYLVDCLHAPLGIPAAKADPDDALRPNQLFAVTLGAISDPEICRRIVTACQALVVPGAIRSLADQPVKRPIAVIHHGQALNDPYRPYQGRYEGDEDIRRKPAYHNGTAWTWVFPTFCEAWALAWGEGAKKSAGHLLSSATPLIRRGCAGHLPEIVDGDFPHQPRGCDAQAWGVSEFLRVWLILNDQSEK